MKSFKEWYKDVAGVEAKYETAANKIQWLEDRELPVVVSCTCCESTMIIFSAYIDDEDYTYCSSCAGVE